MAEMRQKASWCWRVLFHYCLCSGRLLNLTCAELESWLPPVRMRLISLLFFASRATYNILRREGQAQSLILFHGCPTSVCPQHVLGKIWVVTFWRAVLHNFFPCQSPLNVQIGVKFLALHIFLRYLNICFAYEVGFLEYWCPTAHRIR